MTCVDGLKGFPEAIEAVFPKAQVQLCIVHLIRNSLKFVGHQERKTVAQDLKAIYSAPSAQAAEQELKDFAEKWGKTHRSIEALWRRNWGRVIPFFAFPPEIRRIIYTTNAVESLNMSLRKITKMRASFPSAETVVRCVEECFQELAKHAALGCSLESVHPGVGGSDSSRTLVVAFRLVVDYTEIR